MLRQAYILDDRRGARRFDIQKHGKGPITYERSREDPIDRFFGSPLLKIVNGGFLSFGRLQSDHRGIWIDIPIHYIFGFKPPPVLHPDARKLKMRDPRVVNKYLDWLHKEFVKEDLYYRMDKLHGLNSTPLSKIMVTEYEELVTIFNELAKLSEERCRKLRCGEIPWSPTYKKNMMTLLYWQMRKNTD